MRFPAVLALLLLVLSGCHSAAGGKPPQNAPVSDVRRAPESPSQLEGAPPSMELLGPENGEAVCTGTGGLWTENMETCECPSFSVFTKQGCKAFKLSDRAKVCLLSEKAASSYSRQEIQSCFTNIFENIDLTVYLDGIDDEEVFTVLDQLRRDPSQLLLKWAIPGSKDTSRFLIDVARMSRNAVFQGLLEEMGLGRSSASKIIDIPTELRGFRSIIERDLIKNRFWILECTENLKDIGFATDSEVYCSDLLNAIQTVFGTGTGDRSFTRARSNFIKTGPNCYPGCTRTFFLKTLGARQVSASIDYRSYLPFKRTIGIQGDHGEVLAFISPRGSIEGLRATFLAPTHDLTKIISRKTVIVDGGWNLIEREDRESCNLAGVMEKIRSRETLPEDDRRFSFEDREKDLNGPISLMLVESGLHIGVPALTRRIALTDRFLEAANRGDDIFRDFSGNIFPNLFSEVGYLLSILGERSFMHGVNTHGTQMASILVKNIPEAKVHVFPHTIAKHTAAVQWIQKIRSSGAKVVNISADLSSSYYNCNQMFEEIFSALPDTLFVVSSGNSGKENPDFCPARAASGRLANVLSVSGYDPHTNSIAKIASFGLSVSKVAAPIRHACKEEWPIDQLPGNETTTCGGTSVSAAWVSNLAGRYMLKNPSATAADVATAIQGSCKNYGWPVQCGGPIDERRLGL